MVWTKLDDGFPDNPKLLRAIAKVGDVAGWLWVCGINYCNRHLTDGFIQAEVIPRILVHKRPLDVAAALVASGCWDVVEGGYQVHDFTAWNRSRSEVEAQREKWRGKKRGSTVDSKGEPQGNHRGAKKLPRTDTIRDDTKREEEKSPAPAARLSQAELHEQSPREQLFEHWRDVAAAHGVLEPLTRTPKECHQAATLLDVHALDALRGAVTAFWDSASFDGKRSFGMFANQAPQLVAHVRAGKPYAFGAAPRVAEKAERAAKLEAWTPPVPRSAVAR
jgi:hypothetical protein